MEAYQLDEIEVHERLAKKMKRFNTIKSIVDTGLITSTVITGGVSIAAFASGVGLPVGIALSGTSILFSLATAITRKSFKIFTIKQEKHDAIKMLAQRKLDSIADVIYRQCRTETFHLLNFIRYYKRYKNIASLRLISESKLKPRKADHKRTARRIARTRKKRRQRRFYTKNHKYFRYPGCKCHLIYEASPPYSMWFYGL